MKLLIWGCGERCEYFLRNRLIGITDVVGFVDSNETLHEFYGKQVYRPEVVVSLEKPYDYLLVTVKEGHMAKQISETITKLGLNREYVIFLYNYESIITSNCINRQDEAVLKEISEDLYAEVNDSKIQEINNKRMVYRSASDWMEESSYLKDSSFSSDKYQLDYMRYRTFEMCVKELNRYSVGGAVAELGVFKGDFAALINRSFPERRLYLYDSFEGFKEEELSYETSVNSVGINEAKQQFNEVLRHTNVNKVVKKMPFPDKCIIRKGYFPESIQEEESAETFAFVSIDVDLEIPTYEGICFFYSRLSRGGYLFIHDYNSCLWNGVTKAIGRYEEENGIVLRKIPIADQCGTVIIVK